MALINYDIDFTKMVTQLLPTVLRKLVRISWIVACLKALRVLHDKILSFRSARVDDVKWNGQTIKLQNLLIAKFGAGITITNNLNGVEGTVIGTGSDYGSSIGTAFDFDSGIGETYSAAGFDFTVSVPSAIVFVTSEMDAYIRKYKLFGTTFNIVIV